MLSVYRRSLFEHRFFFLKKLSYCCFFDIENCAILCIWRVIYCFLFFFSTFFFSYFNFINKDLVGWAYHHLKENCNERILWKFMFSSGFWEKIFLIFPSSFPSFLLLYLFYFNRPPFVVLQKRFYSSGKHFSWFDNGRDRGLEEGGTMSRVLKW